MRHSLPTILRFLLLLALASSSCAAFGQTSGSLNDDPSDADDASPVPRVARLSFIQGEVSFLRAGVTEWAPGVENLPLLEGDQIYAGRGARAEIQLAGGNYIRLSEDTELTISDLSDSATRLEITEGTAIIRIERLSSAFGRFEVDTPGSAVVLLQDGLYRVGVQSESDSELIVRRGEAEVSTDEGTFKVREGHRLLVDTATGGRLELAVDATRDDWDQWSYDRDNTIARTSADLAPDYVTNYETVYNDFYGASDLSSYGTWTSYSSYGECWMPRVGSDWAPYRSGQWLWIPSAGWTWLSSEPWGWAPYHYGRWAYLSGLGWAWIPGLGSSYRGYGYRDHRWRPALVYFFNCPTPGGNYVGWYPLAPGERWHRPDRNWRADDRAHRQDPFPRDRWRIPEDGGIGRLRQHHGVTILPYKGFAGADRSAVRPAAPGRELADWINRGARPGLPEIKPTPIAVAPALGENDRRSARRVAVPPTEIIRRPVVTRNPDADSTGQFGAPRERRLISPPNRGNVTQGPSLIDRRSNHQADRRPPASTAGTQSGADSGGGRAFTKIRPPLSAPSDNVNSDGAARERKRAREADSGAENRTRESEGATNGAEGERRRARHEQSTAPAPSQSNASGDKQPNDNVRSRERKPPTSDPKPREDGEPRARSDQSARSRDSGASAPQAELRQERRSSENHDQARQERRQEREQRQERQQQQEQRRKP